MKPLFRVSFFVSDSVMHDLLLSLDHYRVMELQVQAVASDNIEKATGPKITLNLKSNEGGRKSGRKHSTNEGSSPSLLVRFIKEGLTTRAELKQEFAKYRSVKGFDSAIYLATHRFGLIKKVGWGVYALVDEKDAA